MIVSVIDIGVAARGVEDELVAVHVDADFADVDDDPVDDVRDRIRAVRADFDLRGDRVDVQREADHDGPEVERADLRAGDRDDRQRRAVVGAGEIDLAGCLREHRADAGADDRVPDFAGGGTRRVGFLLRAADVLGGFDVRFGAERDAREVARQARRQGRRESRDLLFAVFAQDPQVERAVGAAALFCRCRRSPAV